MRDVCQAGSSKLRLVGAEHRQLHPCAWGATASFIHSHASERAAVQRGSFYKSDAGTSAPGWRGNQRPPFAKLTGLSRFPFGGGALTGERLLNARRSQGVWGLDAVKQPIRTGFKKLRKPGERCQRYGIIAPLNVADRLPMYAHQLSQALLSQVGLQPGVSNLLADQSEHLSICHTSSWNAYTPLLTPRIDSVKSWPSLARGGPITARQRGAAEQSLLNQYERGCRMARFLPQLQHRLSRCYRNVLQSTPRCNEWLRISVR